MKKPLFRASFIFISLALGGIFYVSEIKIFDFQNKKKTALYWDPKALGDPSDLVKRLDKRAFDLPQFKFAKSYIVDATGNTREGSSIQINNKLRQEIINYVSKTFTVAINNMESFGIENRRELLAPVIFYWNTVIYSLPDGAMILKIGRPGHWNISYTPRGGSIYFDITESGIQRIGAEIDSDILFEDLTGNANPEINFFWDSYSGGGNWNKYSKYFYRLRGTRSKFLFQLESSGYHGHKEEERLFSTNKNGVWIETRIEQEDSENRSVKSVEIYKRFIKFGEQTPTIYYF